LDEFQQIYNLDILGDRDELITFRDETVKGQGHDETKYGQKSAFVAILSP